MRKLPSVGSRSARNNSEQSLPRRDVFSYHHAGRNLSDRKEQSKARLPSFRMPKSRLKVHHIPTVVMSLLLIICALYLTTLSTSPRVMTLSNDTSRALLRNKSDYESGIQGLLGDNLLNHSKLTINTAKLQRDIIHLYPEIARADVTLPIMGRRPVVELVVAQPKINVVVQSKTYCIDARGYAIAQRGALQDLPTVYDEVGNSDVKIGKQVMSREDVAFITTVHNQLSPKKNKVTHYTLTKQAGEMIVKLQGKAYVIKMNLYTDPNIAIGSYFATIKKLEAERQIPKEYIDVRVEERVYVK